MLVAGLVQLPKGFSIRPLERPLVQVFKASFEYTQLRFVDTMVAPVSQPEALE